MVKGKYKFAFIGSLYKGNNFHSFIRYKCFRVLVALQYFDLKDFFNKNNEE